MPCQLIFRLVHALHFPLSTVHAGFGSRRSSASVVAASGTLTGNSVSVCFLIHSISIIEFLLNVWMHIFVNLAEINTNFTTDLESKHLGKSSHLHAWKFLFS
ncbi:hypothetical protein V6N12_047578 [Hibiscus sabdariffa]|uniref:Uncharacterized protein n=1 Tax=Hibiscus sabdariffa TaxID=183260 RepID=A0ABR2AEY0_9ROSI